MVNNSTDSINYRNQIPTGGAPNKGGSPLFENLNKMKKSILAFAIFALAMIIISSCGKKEIKDVRALVSSIHIVDDTLKSMKATVDGDTLLFSMADVRLNNGMMIHGDSVVISYIDGRNDSLRALLVTIIPKAPHYVNLDSLKNDILITAPARSSKDTAE